VSGIKDPPPFYSWRVPASAFLATPAVSDSLAFFLLADHHVRALDKRTGAFVWSSETVGFGTGDNAELLVAGGLVLDLDASVFAFDRRSGALKWAYTDLLNPGAFVGRGAADSLALYAGSVSGDLFAIRLNDGGLRWKLKIATDTVTTRVNDPTIDGGTVFATYQRFGVTTSSRTGGVAAVDAVTGTLLWQTELPAETALLPAGGVGRVQVSATLAYAVNLDGRVFALRRSDGSVAWTIGRNPSYSASQFDFRRIVLAGNRLIYDSSDGSVTAVDATTGSLIWKTTPSPVESILDPMTFDGSNVFLALLGGQIAKLDPATGTLTKLTPKSDTAYFGVYPAVDSTRLYAQTREGLYALPKPQ
jgi:outer membrane protein assembly factor BamB